MLLHSSLVEGIEEVLVKQLHGNGWLNNLDSFYIGVMDIVKLPLGRLIQYSYPVNRIGLSEIIDTL